MPRKKKSKKKTKSVSIDKKKKRETRLTGRRCLKLISDWSEHLDSSTIGHTI